MSYYFSNDESLKSNIKTIQVIIQDTPFSFYTDNGVFSKDGLDFGTRSLLENIDDIHGKVLDLGCGYGPIGIFLTKKFNTNTDMVDINKRSLNLCLKNAELNKIKANIFESDGFSNIDKKYDYIVTNPPIRVGKVKLYELLFGAKNHLAFNGELWLVVSRDQGAKSLCRDLESTYEVEVIAKNKGFYVIKCKNTLK